MYKEITRIGLDDVPFIMLIQPKSYVGINPAIKGCAITRSGSCPFPG